jgi:hypothetical protein
MYLANDTMLTLRIQSSFIAQFKFTLVVIVLFLIPRISSQGVSSEEEYFANDLVQRLNVQCAFRPRFAFTKTIWMF